MTTVLLNNRYRILQELGRGGFSQTFLAIDTHRPSQRRCAIKKLKLVTQASQQWVEKRFEREAAILEELGENNDQIPGLYAYFSEAGIFFLVQEWIEGLTLTQKQQQEGLLPEAEVREILVNLLPVLDYVHSHRIVHRDIKPDNIILRQRDGKPVLIDFGIVKEAMTTVVNSQGNVTSSMAVGTPGYMPSEQAAGRPLYSSDLYSLGLTAVYLLTGKMPYNLEVDSRTGEILWRQEAPNLHSNLAVVIEQAIRYHPRDRFASAAEMLDALQDQPVASTVPTQAVSPDSPKTVMAATTAVPPTPVTQGSGVYKVAIATLLVGGVAAAAVGWGLFRANERPLPVASPPESNPEPNLEQPISPLPSPTESPEVEPSPVLSSSPSPTPEPSPEPPEVSPPPSPIEVSPAPKPSPQNQNSNLISVPRFPTGTSESTIREALGEPTSTSKGYWPNTRAVLYSDLVTNKIDLGYLFDRDTGSLRQTEVSFSQSVDQEVMQKTLDGLLRGNTPSSAKQGLQQVYERQSDRHSFTVGQLKGLIQRNQRDRVYIGVWEADLH